MNSQHPHQDLTNSLSLRLSNILTTHQLKHLDLCAGRIGGRRLAWRSDTPAPLQTLHDSNAAQHSSQDCDQPSPLANRRYLVASITKPVVAMLTLQMAAEGLLSLTDRLESFLPAFDRAGLRRITIRNVLTHTSGLPDMLPNNEELRAEHAELAKFAAQTAEVTLDFPVGTDSRYSSMGFAALGQILSQVGGASVAELLRERIFMPLGMRDSWLGFPVERAEELLPTALPCELPIWQPDQADWNWNSRYWRTLGATWGGLISTAADLERFARAMLSPGSTSESDAVFSDSVVQAAVSNQLAELPELHDTARRTRAWGLGWRRNWQDHSASFGDFLPPEVVGHWGATGTLMWLWPAQQMYAVILTTTPYEQSRTAIQKVSNLITAALR